MLLKFVTRPNSLMDIRFHAAFHRIERFFVTDTTQMRQIHCHHIEIEGVGEIGIINIPDLRRNLERSEKSTGHRAVTPGKSASQLIHPVLRTMYSKPVQHPKQILHIEVVPLALDPFPVNDRPDNLRHTRPGDLATEIVHPGVPVTLAIQLPRQEMVKQRRFSELLTRPDDKVLQQRINRTVGTVFEKKQKEREGKFGRRRPQLLQMLDTRRAVRTRMMTLIDKEKHLHLLMVGS